MSRVRVPGVSVSLKAYKWRVYVICKLFCLLKIRYKNRSKDN
uniref:Uncharacterized protein n=1 Tax=Phage sp. ctgh419 TaxID=2828009 RepID=A0A8S5SM17_9VIRU|nr:MAG TPA: hypothetical protein [Phage sp. ctgh419]DAS98468.1 MAG TPA: hypothetical protein [Caudoviricetes sp.]